MKFPFPKTLCSVGFATLTTGTEAFTNWMFSFVRLNPIEAGIQNFNLKINYFSEGPQWLVFEIRDIPPGYREGLKLHIYLFSWCFSHETLAFPSAGKQIEVWRSNSEILSGGIARFWFHPFHLQNWSRSPISIRQGKWLSKLRKAIRFNVWFWLERVWMGWLQLIVQITLIYVAL